LRAGRGAGRSIVFGLGHVLREKITIKGGRVQESNFID
jgi:hypothetical protein